MEQTIFDKILAGDIPSHCVYQDDHVFAFLDINPLSRGHTLVIPREREAKLDQLSDESAAAIGRALPRICRAVMQATGCKSYNILQNNGKAANQEVMHVHFHIIPKPDPPSAGNTGLGIKWQANSLDNTEGKALADAIAEAID